MDEFLTGQRSTRWLWIAAIWLGVGLIDASQTVFPMRAQGMHHAWVRLFLTLMLSWLPWALASPLVIGMGRRYSFFRGFNFQAIFAHLSAVTAIGLVTAAWSALLDILLNPWARIESPGPFVAVWLPKFYYGLLTSLIVYAFILAATLVLDSRERMARHQTATARLNEQLSMAQLNTLRQQLEPHFMFNTLNAISGLVRDNRNDAAVSMIVGLSDFLRRTAEDFNQPQVALAQELEHLQRYLEIQQVRFAERLQLRVDIPAELLSIQVPSLILQPLVENAIKHGISKLAAGGSIQVAGSCLQNKLCLSVCNDGPWLPGTPQVTGSGIGLSNLRIRLQILYGTEFELNLRNQDKGGVEVRVSIPATRNGVNRVRR